NCGSAGELYEVAQAEHISRFCSLSRTNARTPRSGEVWAYRTARDTHMGARYLSQTGRDLNGKYCYRLLREPLPAQMVDATLAWSLSAGVWNPKVFLGR